MLIGKGACRYFQSGKHHVLQQARVGTEPLTQRAGLNIPPRHPPGLFYLPPPHNRQRSPGMLSHPPAGYTPRMAMSLINPLACSPFLQGLDDRHPEWRASLQQEGRLDDDIPPAEQTLHDTILEHGLDAGLRRFRNREMLRITWRELTASASLEQTLSDLSTLAELCLQAAIDAHEIELTERFGVPRDSKGTKQSLVVLGLGKLGGGELNLSSDIDLILAYPAAGSCDGRRGLDNEQFFTRLSRAVIGSLATLTEEGFVFRVDTRLRPFGDAGPLVCSFAALENYYQREGRDWERYALLKARPVAGDRGAGDSLLQQLKPFVYRRYIDFGAVESLRSMLDSIRADAARKGRVNDVKRGPGGIREVEFLVQCVQLLRGGRETILQTPSLLRALSAIETLALFPEERVLALRNSYAFLRRVENAIQAQQDQQTHTLPDGGALQRITRIMGLEAPEDLFDLLDQTRATVTAALDESFPRQQEPDPGDTNWRERLPGDSKAFLASLERRGLSERGRQRLDEFMPRLLLALQERPADESVMADVFELVLAVSQRSAYLALLVQNPPALERMLDLFIASDWIATTVVRHPALLDELLDPALGRDIPDREALSNSVGRLATRGSEEDQINALNYLKLAQSLRIAVAELDNVIDAGKAEALLTELAEVMLERCLVLAEQMLSQRHDPPLSEGLAIIGYGSLGGADISYRSDLDLVFLYPDDMPENQHAMAPETWFTRVVRRLLAIATTTTPSGKLYDIDTRLRPNGRAGLLVSPIGAFERYQREKAWVWEWQALIRARPVAGNKLLGGRFGSVRRKVLEQERDAAVMRTEVASMRARLREQHAGDDPLKHGPGGLLDIDFLAQLGVLCEASRVPELCEATATQDQLAALGACGWLDPADALALAQTHRELTGARHLQALCRNGCRHVPDTSRAAAICHKHGITDSA